MGLQAILFPLNPELFLTILASVPRHGILLPILPFRIFPPELQSAALCRDKIDHFAHLRYTGFTFLNGFAQLRLKAKRQTIQPFRAR